MGKSVLNRKMFMQPPVKKAKGGIISLFNDIVGEDEDAFADRTPDNPEILANNIRGDIKSLDERYEELAQVLGEKAYETPEEVLVYMQSQMPKAQQPQAPAPAPAQGGIASMAQQAPPNPQQPPQAGPPQPPGGIESLVAPPQPGLSAPAQPVQRAMGSGPMGEMSDPLASAVENFIDSGGTFEQLVAMAAGDMPVQRAGGSTESGERVDPRFRDPMTRQFFIPEGMEGPIPTTEAPGTRSNMSKLERQLVQEGVLDADPSQRPSAEPKSRPLTPDELRAQVIKREAPTRGLTFLRDLDELAKTRFGLDPAVVRQRLEQGLNVASKLPGVGKLGKIAKGLSRTDAAVGSAALGFGAGALYDYLTPDGEDPTMSKHPVVSNIPLPGELPPPKELVREEINYPPVAEVNLIERDLEAADEGITGQQGGLPENISAGKAPVGAGKAGADKEDAASNFEKRVRARADIYKRLMGDDPDMRKAQAHFILAEAGLALAGAKGRSLGERLSKGLRGVPSAFGALASEQTQLNRAATTAAIAAIEQQDRDAMSAAAQIQKAMLSSSGKGLPRLQQIAARTSVLQQGYGMSPEEAQQTATLMVDGGLSADKFANIRDPLGNVVRYGPLNKPMGEGDIGYIPTKHPYARQPEARPIPVLAEADMAKVRDEISEIEKMVVTLQGAKTEIAKAVGPLNVLTRGITRVTQPLFGDIGPLSADKVAVTRAVDNANKVLQKFAAINPERVSVYEQKENKRLQIDGDSLFTSPDIEIGKLMGIETYLTNQLNSLRYQLNPRDTEYRQMEVPNLGSKNDPVPTSAYTLLPEYFAARPTATLYVKRPDGSTIGVTRDWAVSQGLIK
jgi:hypothetical protein